MSEFVVFLGCNLFIARFEGILDRRKWWSSLSVNEFKGAPIWLGKYISPQHFEDTIQGLWHTNHP